MPEHVIVWDIETVPDLKAYTAASDLSGLPDEKIRERLGDTFPKPIFHKIACIGALIASSSDGKWQIDSLGAPHIGERSEGELIRAFVDRIAELRPRLVTFNGSSFDLRIKLRPSRFALSRNDQQCAGARGFLAFGMLQPGGIIPGGGDFWEIESGRTI